MANQGRESQLHLELYLNPANQKILVLLPPGAVSPPYNRGLTPENPTPYLIQWQAKISEVAPKP